jgi:co-chaperonin GroES (HSP10)
MRSFEPVYNQMLIAREEFKYKGLIEIPDKYKTLPTVGEIVAIGPLVTTFAIGEKVMFSRMSGHLITALDKTHPRANPDTDIVEWILISEDEVLCRVKDSADHQESTSLEYQYGHR